MTKAQFKAKASDDKKAALLELFDDPGGEIASGTVKSLNAFIDTNWDYIDSIINPVEEASEEGEEIDGQDEAEVESEEVVEEEADEEEVLEEDLSQPNPRTDLYTGRIPGPREELVIHEG